VTIQHTNMKLQRWKIRLSEYDFEIKYLEGRQNHVADALSRIKINEVYYGSNKENLMTITEKTNQTFRKTGRNDSKQYRR